MNIWARGLMPRVSKVTFFAEKVALNFDLEALFMNQNDVVKSKCEYEFWRIRLGQSFGMLAALIWLNLGSWGHIACLLDICSSTPVDDNLGLEALYSRRFGQGFQKCKRKSWRLLIGLQFDMLILIIKAKLRSWGALAWLLGDVNIHVSNGGFGLPTQIAQGPVHWEV